MDLELKELAGKLSAYAQLGMTRWRVPIASWNAPFTQTFPLFHVNNCGFTFTNPTCGDNVCSPAEDASTCGPDCHPPTAGGGPTPAPPTGPDDRVCLKRPWLC